ncbi:MAG TPA: hypothetical protein VE525_07675 [Rubrobacter sp.]|nr:hypothetical protein [Rubrobacter sp.]
MPGPKRPLMLVVLVVLWALLGVVAGLDALVGAAVVTSRPPLFLLAGLAAFCAVYLFGVVLVTRKSRPADGACAQSCSSPGLFW